MHLEAVVHSHAAAFIGRTPWDVAHDELLLADAHKTAWMCYRHRLVIAGIDLFTLEAEAWGLRAKPSERADVFTLDAPLVPTLAAITKLPDLDPANSERLALVLRAVMRLQETIPATVAVPVAGPLTLAEALLGREALLRELAGGGLAAAHALVQLVQKLTPLIRAVAELDAEIAIAETDYSPDLIPPDLYNRCVYPALCALVKEAHAATHVAPAVLIGGDTAPIAPSLCGSGARMVVCPEATNRAAFLEVTKRYPDLTVRLDLPRELWTDGDWSRVCREIADASAFARNNGRIILGTGPLAPHASSVLVVDACNFAMNMDAWLDPL